jgi:hypothetical protein
MRRCRERGRKGWQSPYKTCRGSNDPSPATQAMAGLERRMKNVCYGWVRQLTSERNNGVESARRKRNRSV